MSKSRLTVVARFKAREGKAEELQTTLMALVEPTRKETGCLNYDLHRSVEASDEFLFHENWTSKAELDVHLNTPHIQAMREKVEALQLLAQPVELTLWHEILT